MVFQFAEGAVGERVAVWQAGPWGLSWIEEAASHDGGGLLSRNGYPNFYLVRAADLLSTIRSHRPYVPPMYEYGHATGSLQCGRASIGAET